MRTIYLDASSLKKRFCRRAYWGAVGLGLVSRDLAEVLKFGKAVHKFAELRATMDNKDAMAQAISMYDGKDGALLVRACMSCPPEVALGPVARMTEGTIGVEHKFSVPYGETFRGQNDEYNVIICGTMDRINLSGNGQLEIIDYKTTRIWDRDRVDNTYRHDVQFTFYLWAAQKYAYQIFPNMDVANAAWYNRMHARVCPVFLAAKPMPRWELLSPIVRTFDQLKRFDDMIRHTVEEIVAMFDADPTFAEALPTGMIHNSCAGCDFRSICFAQSDEAADQIMTTFFETKTYNPLLW